MAKVTPSKSGASADANTHTQPEATTGDDALDVSGAGAVFQELLAENTSHKPDAALVAEFDRQISEAEAWARGRRLSSDKPLHDAMRDLPSLATVVIARRVPGFGPSEFHYTVDLALQCWTQHGTLLDAGVKRAGVSAGKAASIGATKEHLEDLYAILDSCIPASSSRRAEFDAATRHGSNSAAKVTTTLRALALVGRNLLDDAANNAALAALYADKGLTSELVSGGGAKSTKSAAAQTKHTAAQKTLDAAQHALDVLDGRLRNQLLRLRRQVEKARARASGSDIPEVKLTSLRATHPVTSDDEPATPVTRPVTPT